MEIIKKPIEKNKNGLSSIEFVKNGKYMRLGMTDLDFLTVSFSYDEGLNNHCFQESFEITKSDGELYKDVDKAFWTFGGDVFFDSIEANLVLFNEENGYRFFFMGELSEASNEIKSILITDSQENNRLRELYMKLQPKEKEKTDKKTLSKTLDKIVEKPKE